MLVTHHLNPSGMRQVSGDPTTSGCVVPAWLPSHNPPSLLPVPHSKKSRAWQRFPTAKPPAKPRMDTQCDGLLGCWVLKTGLVRRTEKERPNDNVSGLTRASSGVASTGDLCSPVMILQPESEKDLDTLSRAFEVRTLA